MVLATRFEKFRDRETSIKFDQLPVESGDRGDDVAGVAKFAGGFPALFFMQTFGNGHGTRARSLVIW